MGYDVAWEDLRKALSNEEACSRYDNGYRAEEKEKSEVEKACGALKTAIEKRGRIYGNVSYVRSR